MSAIPRAVSYQKKTWLAQSKPSFEMTTAKILKDAFLQHATHLRNTESIQYVLAQKQTKTCRYSFERLVRNQFTSI